jgi:hypothetical protein
LRSASDPSNGRKSCDDQRYDELTAGQINPTPDDFDRLTVPVQAAVVIDAKAVTFDHCDRPNVARPLALIDLLKRDALQFGFAFGILLFSPNSFFLSFHLRTFS